MRRRYGWIAVVVALACVAGLAVFVAGMTIAASAGVGVIRAVFIGGGLTPVLGGAASFGLLARARARERAAAASASGYACPNCLYDLSAEPVERCSECGQGVVYEALPVLWENASWRRAWSGRLDGLTGFSASGLSAFEVRAKRWGLALSLLIPLACFVPSQAVFYGTSGAALGVRFGLTMLVLVVSVVLVIGPVFVLLFRKKKLLERELVASGGLSCPACLEDLSGGEVDACPSCGQRVDYATLERSWRTRMRVLGLGARGSET